MVKYPHYLAANLPDERLYYEIKLAWLDGLLIKKLHKNDNISKVKFEYQDNLVLNGYASDDNAMGYQRLCLETLALGN